MIKVYHAAGMINYSKWLNNVEIVDKPEEADVLLFEGGSDVSPYLYDEEVGSYTMTNLDRDINEKDLFEKYPDKFKLGICRGAQLATVLSGGKLIQHVTGHNNSEHCITFNDGKQLAIPSDHHQMLLPGDVEHELIAWSSHNKSIVYYNGHDKEIKLPDNFKEPEVIWYPKTKSLAIQAHPEWTNDINIKMYMNDLFLEYFNAVEV